jgi:hypothetical protein
MPIVRFKNKNVYFSHIPKCAGTSIELFLIKSTGANLSFLDTNHYKNTNEPWTKSSPQHITGNDLSRLFPLTFFDEFFTVTREPFDRFCSAFTFQKYITRRINHEIDINQFLSNLDEYKALLPGHFDNHFLPQNNFLYPGASYEIFKFENGMGGVKKYISSLFDVDVNNISIPHLFKQKSEIKLNIDKLNNQSKKIILEIYKLDFEKFNY